MSGLLWPVLSTIARAYGLIPDSYLMKAHKMVIREIVTGSVAGDSTGYSNNGLVRWYDVRTDSIKNRKGWVKLHSIIDMRTRVVLDYIVTDSSVADINGLRPMLDRFGGGTGNFCLDAAYLAQEICNIIDGKGMMPRICPKSNTVHNAQGSQSWRSMIDLYVSDPTRFKLEYHQRSIRGRVWRHQKDVREPHQVPQAREPVQGDCDAHNLLQHRTRGPIPGK